MQTESADLRADAIESFKYKLNENDEVNVNTLSVRVNQLVQFCT